MRTVASLRILYSLKAVTSSHCPPGLLILFILLLPAPTNDLSPLPLNSFVPIDTRISACIICLLCFFFLEHLAVSIFCFHFYSLPDWNFILKLKCVPQNPLVEDKLLWRNAVRPLLDVEQLLVPSLPTPVCTEALLGVGMGIWGVQLQTLKHSSRNSLKISFIIPHLSFVLGFHQGFIPTCRKSVL